MLLLIARDFRISPCLMGPRQGRGGHYVSLHYWAMSRSSMITFNFSVVLKQDSCGFENGDLIVAGEGGEYRFNCMVVLTASLLLDQIKAWIPSRDRELVFLPIDYTRSMVFQKRRELISVSAEKKVFGTSDRWSLVTELVDSCEKFNLEFVRHLPASDAGRHDFEASLQEFKASRLR